MDLTALTPTEQGVLDRLQRGEIAGATGPVPRGGVMELSASFLLDLLVNAVALDIPASGIRLSGVRVRGQFTAAHAEFQRPIELANSSFEAPIKLDGLRAESLELVGCIAPSVSARDVHVRTRLVLTDTEVGGSLDLTYARVGSRLAIEGGSFRNSRGRAIDLRCASISGDVDLQTTHAQRLRCDGTVDLSNAKIKGNLTCAGILVRTPGEVALDVNGVDVSGSCFLVSTRQYRFEVVGAVDLMGACIHDQLSCAGASISSSDLPAVRGDGVVVDGDVACVPNDGGRFEAVGEVRFPGAQISGDLNLAGAILSNLGGLALNGRGMNVGGAVFLRALPNARFIAYGTVLLVGADLGVQATFAGGLFFAPGRVALNLEAASARQSMFLTSYEGHAFEAWGTVVLAHAKAHRFLICQDGIFRRPAPSGISFDAEHLEVGGTMAWKPLELEGGADFSFASTDLFIDDPASASVTPKLEDFSYRALSPLERADERLQWISGQDGYFPSSYEQLIAVYRRAGYLTDARKVARAKQERERRELRGAERWWNWFVGRFVGHGYQSWRPGLLLLFFVLVGWGIFNHAFHLGAMEVARSGPTPDAEPLMYSLDVALPIVDFHQQFWVPDTRAPAGDLYRAWYWFLIGAGWILTTLFIGGISGALKRD